MRRHPIAAPGLGVLAAVAAACGGSQPAANPVAPPVATGLSIEPLGQPLKPGQSAQLVARAALSDGTSLIVNKTSVWLSAGSSVATVSATGVTTAVADGRTTITVAHGGRTSSAVVVVRQGGATLSGRVTESAPTEDTAIAGARVEIGEGVYAGTAATTNADGTFTLEDVAGTLPLTISHPAYEKTAVVGETAQPLLVRARPLFRTIDVTHEWLRKDRFDPGIDEVSFTVDVHHPGTLWLEAYGVFRDSDAAAPCLEVRTDERVVLFVRGSWGEVDDQTVPVSSGRRYRVVLYACKDRPWNGGIIYYYVRLIHPS